MVYATKGGSIMCKLLSTEQLNTIPKLYETEDLKDPLCHIKLFTPDANYSWYIIERSMDENLCYGYVKGLENELGYFCLDEIANLRGSLGLPVEIDSSFTPTLLSDIKKDDAYSY